MSGPADAFRTHKGPLGLGCVAAALGCFFAGYRFAAEAVGIVAALLLGAGYLRDDRWERDEQGQYVRMPRP